jgi:hypothetical protein
VDISSEKTEAGQTKIEMITTNKDRPCFIFGMAKIVRW